jgi:hypothetical protein
MRRASMPGTTTGMDCEVHVNTLEGFWYAFTGRG